MDKGEVQAHDCAGQVVVNEFTVCIRTSQGLGRMDLRGGQVRPAGVPTLVQRERRSAKKSRRGSRHRGRSEFKCIFLAFIGDRRLVW